MKIKKFQWNVLPDEEKTEVQRMARILEDAMDEENKAWNVEKVISYKWNVMEKIWKFWEEDDQRSDEKLERMDIRTHHQLQTPKQLRRCIGK